MGASPRNPTPLDLLLTPSSGTILAMRQALASVLVVVLTSGLTVAAMACSCERNPTAEGLLERAAVVFTGVAQASAAVAPGQAMTTFTVVESFKGSAAGATVRVRHPNGASASCGVKFSPGETYTLAAHRAGSKPDLATSLCSTWMFAPQVGTGAGLIRRMREIRGNP